MSSIQFLCSSCRHRLQVDESQKGKQAICPICGAQMTVPVVEAAATAASAPPLPNDASNYGQRPTASPFQTPQAAGVCPHGCPCYPPPTEPFAIASFVCSVAGISILGIIFGHIAMNKINASGGQLGGRGFAKAGLIIGYVFLGLMLFIMLLQFCLVMTMLFGVSAMHDNFDVEFHESMASEEQSLDLPQEVLTPEAIDEEQPDTDTNDAKGDPVFQ